MNLGAISDLWEMTWDRSNPEDLHPHPRHSQPKGKESKATERFSVKPLPAFCGYADHDGGKARNKQPVTVEQQALRAERCQDGADTCTAELRGLLDSPVSSSLAPAGRHESQ